MCAGMCVGGACMGKWNTVWGQAEIHTEDTTYQIPFLDETKSNGKTSFNEMPYLGKTEGRDLGNEVREYIYLFHVQA